MSQHNPKYTGHKELIGTRFCHDQRINQVKQILHTALQEYQQKVTKITPPNPALKQSYDEMIASFIEYRGNKLWFPYIGSGFGNGALVELADGSVKYDFISGVGVHFFGHNHPDILNALVESAISNTIMQGHLQQNVDSLELSSALISASGLDHCLLTTAGALANENALKIAFQKRFPANRILTFNRCFLGRTLATAQITDKASYREGLPSNFFVDYIPFFDEAHPKESTDAAKNALNDIIRRYPNQHALMCFELVQGEGGCYTGSHHFFTSLMEILKANDIAILVDEVQTFGRTDQLFAFQHFNLQSFVDIVTVGKLLQVCATLFTEKYKPRPGLISQTFTSSTSAIKAATVILNKLLNENFFGANGKNAVFHHYFVKQLKNLAERYPKYLSGPFGMGSMIAFTLFDGNEEKSIKFVRRLFDAGVMSFIAGGEKYPTRIRFLLPSGAISFYDLDKVFAVLEETLVAFIQEMEVT